MFVLRAVVRYAELRDLHLNLSCNFAIPHHTVGFLSCAAAAAAARWWHLRPCQLPAQQQKSSHPRQPSAAAYASSWLELCTPAWQQP